jgi:hypothetical protein
MARIFWMAASVLGADTAPPQENPTRDKIPDLHEQEKGIDIRPIKPVT